MVETEPDQHGARRRLVGFAALGVAIVVVVVLLVTSPWSSDAKPDATAGTTHGTAGGPTTSAGAPTTSAGAPTGSAGAPTGSANPDHTPAVQVPIATVDVNGPGGACAAVVARLKLYSEAAKQTAASDLQPLFEQLSEFEDEVFQDAQGQTWGDKLVAQIVVVRRGWVDAGSAFDSGDKAAAGRAAAKANALLDHIIATAPC
jgi:hypothetical protein